VRSTACNARFILRLHHEMSSFSSQGAINRYDHSVLRGNLTSPLKDTLFIFLKNLLLLKIINLIVTKKIINLID
jgi:hypothetical protein